MRCVVGVSSVMLWRSKLWSLVAAISRPAPHLGEEMSKKLDRSVLHLRQRENGALVDTSLVYFMLERDRGSGYIPQTNLAPFAVVKV